MPVKLYIFDADETLRRTRVPGQPCPHRPDEWELLPGVREVLREIPFGPGGPRLAIASNQDHVGYGHLTADTCRAMLEALAHAATDGRVTDPLVAFCPHVLEVECACRKPAPGMLLDLARRAGVRPDEALFVGDADTDEEAARRAGIPFVRAHVFFRR